MFGPTPTSGWSLIMCPPSSIIATRSRLVGLFRSKMDMNRVGAMPKKIAATSGRTASSRKSLSKSSSATAAMTPIQALRDCVSEIATSSAGMTSTAHIRSRRPKRILASAMPMTSISRPE